MDKRQRKKKWASNPLRALIASSRRMLRRHTLMSEVLVNDAYQKLREYLRYCHASELERIERGPMTWIGYRRPDADFSKVSGTHAAAGKPDAT